MNPSPEQIAEWEKRAEKAWNIDDNISNFDVTERGYIQGYIRARTEQALEEAVAIIAAKPSRNPTYLIQELIK